MYEKILVPLDGSPLAEVALPYAEELAGRLDSEVILLSVAESAETERQREFQTYLQKMVEATKRGAERYLKEAKGKAIKVDSMVLVGRPAEVIVDYAEKEDIGLTVMATHGRSGISRWFLGSTAGKVMEATERPIALIRAKGASPDIREKGILNKALVPLDGSSEGEVVLPYIEELAAKLKAEVILLQVVARVYHVYAAAEAAAQIAYSDEEMAPLIASATDYLAKVADRLKGKGINTRFEVKIGTADQEIIKLADEIYADAVVISTHGQSGIGRWVLGSITDRVLHAGNTPLLLVRTPKTSAA